MSQYWAGSATVTNGSQIVTGTGTAWLNNTQAGNVFSVKGSGVPYVIGSVNSNTQITLASPYAGNTAATISYAITTSYTPNLGIPYPQGGDIDTATILMRAMLLIDQDLATPGVTINATSATSLTPTTGSITFAIQTGKQYAYPQYVIIASQANPANYMAGQVTSYNAISGSLVVNVLTCGGSGTHTDWQISLSGTVGATGSQGATGPANNLTIGTVTAGAAAASITGTAPNQTLNLTLQTGAMGATGPANSLNIGTVSSGPAAATITGTAPTQTLNLTIPTGATGATGSTGATGPANTLSIGTVTNGGAAAATITGTAPAQTLNLVLPTGATGATGPGWNQFKGAWSNATAYIVNDVVTVSGSSYICIAGNTNNSPPNATYWNVVALAGTGVGTVTSASVTTANGISGTVANASTTPAISLAIATQAAGDNTANGATTAFVQTAVNGAQTINVAGNANIILAATQAAAQIITYTGALTGNITVAVPAAAKTFTVINNTTGAFTLTQIAAGGTGIVVTQGKSQELTCNGVNVILASNDLVGAGIASLAGNTFSGSQNWATPVSLASGATVAVGAAAANDITITGNTTITAFDSIAAGAYRRLTFSGVLTLTYNATSMILPGAANIVTAAGDVAEFVSQGGGNWKCIAYNRASGVALVAASTVQAWSTIAAATTAVAGAAYMCNTSGGAFVVTLPASPIAGNAVRIADYAGSFVANNLTIAGNGANIMGLAQNMILSTNYVSITLTYIDTNQGWKLT